VIENPGEETGYEDEDDDEDDSGRAKDRPVITAQLYSLDAARELHGACHLERQW